MSDRETKGSERPTRPAPSRYPHDEPARLRRRPPVRVVEVKSVRPDARGETSGASGGGPEDPG